MIGIALSWIGRRQRGTAELEAALANFEETLREQPPERAQRDWSHTRLTTGYTMLLLGNRLGDPEKLQTAEQAFSNAIAVLPVMDRATAHKALSRPLLSYQPARNAGKEIRESSFALNSGDRWRAGYMKRAAGSGTIAADLEPGDVFDVGGDRL